MGADIKGILGLDDYVADFEITSNRPDCLSVIGLARETAATFNRPFSVKAPVVKGSGDAVENYLSVKVKNPDLCMRYIAKIVKNIKIEPSPAWMRERLHACGVRPINNIVDITNYVMLEYGQPMHAFDYACLSDGKIIVRTAARGETCRTLDGAEHDVTESMLCICDGTKPVAVAGVMGGENSEITDTTKTVVFESACFSGPSVRLTAKALGMRTESSGRFEKGLDPQQTLPAILRACELIEALGAGEVVSGMIDCDASSHEPRTLAFEPDKINTLLGIDVSRAQQIDYLSRLEFKVEGHTLIIPSFRGDIERMCDVAEEVARLYGYDNIPTTLYGGAMVQGEYTAEQQMERAVSSLCRQSGFDEAMTLSFISPKYYDMISWAADDVRRKSVKILNPLGEDYSIMRTTVLPSLLDSLAHNAAHRNPTASLFEIGYTYLPKLDADGNVDADVLPSEEKVLTLAVYGRLSFFQMKGVIENLMKLLGIKDVSFTAQTENPSYHPGRCASILIGSEDVGVFGTLHPTVCKRYDIAGEVLTAEISMRSLFKAANPVKLYAPLPKYPASTRDIAVIVDDSVPAAAMQHAIACAVGGILESVRLFDVYTGESIPEGKKSLAYSISMRAPDRTLTDAECDQAMKSALNALEKEFHAILRG